MVKIVGAGPGAKDLITVRGMHMLNEADVYSAPSYRRSVIIWCNKRAD